MSFKSSSPHILEAAFVSLFLSVIVFVPQWRYGFNLGDEGWLWYLSQRIGAGDVPIRDFFAYDPGRYYWSWAWFQLLGHDGLLEQRIANASFGAVGLMFAYGCMCTAQVPRSWRLIASCMIAFALGYPRHKTYEQALSLISITVSMAVLLRPQSLLRWAIIGIAAGLAAVVGRNSGIYFLVTAGFNFLWTATTDDVRALIRRAFAYGAGVIGGFLPVLFLVISDPKFRAAFFVSVKNVASWELPLPVPFPWRQSMSFDDMYSLQKIAISWLCVAVFVVYSVALVRTLLHWRNRRDLLPSYLLETSACFAGIPYLHHGFDRADFSHIAQGIVPVFVLVTAMAINGKYILKAQHILIFSLALLSWAPSEPGILIESLYKRDAGSQRFIDIDGHDYLVDSQTASLMLATKKATDLCGLRDGSFMEAPIYPGLYAYLHIRAPIWELYFLYQRSARFQIDEISEFEKWKPTVVLLNENATVDSRASLYLTNSNPLLLTHVHTYYERYPTNWGAGDGNEFWMRDCRSERVLRR